jgi:hypothetical protein
MLLAPYKASRRAVGRPERVERSDNCIVIALRVAKVGYDRFLVVMGAILFGNIQKHLSINGVETLVFSRKIVIYQSVFQKQILKNLFVVIEASKAGGTKERIDIKQVAGV